MRPHFDALYRTARRTIGNAALAEEVVQESCLKAYLAFERDEPIGSFKPWIFRILINRCVDALRDRGRVEFVPVDAVPAILEREAGGSAAANPEQVLVDAGLRASIDAAIAALAPELRVVVLLVLIEELSYAEAAESLQIPVKKVRARLHRARTHLRVALAGSLGERRIGDRSDGRAVEPVCNGMRPA